MMNLALNMGRSVREGGVLRGPIRGLTLTLRQKKMSAKSSKDEDVDDFIQRELDSPSFLRIDWSVTV